MSVLVATCTLNIHIVKTVREDYYNSLKHHVKGTLKCIDNPISQQCP